MTTRDRKIEREREKEKIEGKKNGRVRIESQRQGGK